MPVKMHTVDSSGIAAIGYDEATSRIHVQFKSNPDIYARIKTSTPAEFDDFLNDPHEDSHGKHYHKHLRGDAKKDWEKLARQGPIHPEAA